MTLPRLLAAAGVLASALLTASPAHAGGPLSVTASCDPLGQLRISCTAVAAGGTGSYSYQWSVSSVDEPSVIAWCYTGDRHWETVPVTVTVTDGAGATAHADTTALCTNGPPS